MVIFLHYFKWKFTKNCKYTFKTAHKTDRMLQAESLWLLTESLYYTSWKAVSDNDVIVNIFSEKAQLKNMF